MVSDFLTRIVNQKRQDISRARRAVSEGRLAEQARQRTDFRPFFEALRRPGAAGVNIIAEIKRASPSKGALCPDLDAACMAAQYAAGGAAAVSVLTDATFFKGSLDDLRTARAACGLPVLRKEFIISRYQVYEAAVAGADAILLIARILTADMLNQLYALGRDLGMDALVEIHTPKEVHMAAACGARLVGINNRNLSTFRTDIALAETLADQLAPGQVAVAASGIMGPADVQRNRRAGVFNFLVGESIVRAADPAGFIRHLLDRGGDGAPDGQGAP